MNKIDRWVNKEITKQRKYSKNIEKLKKAYVNRVIYDTKKWLPPIMTEQEFIDAWMAEPKKLKFRHNGPDGWMMMLVDFDSPLSVDNYQLVVRKNRNKHIDYINYPQKALRMKISESRKGMTFTEQHKKNLSEAHKGIRDSDDKKKAKSVSAKRRHARERMEKIFNDAVVDLYLYGVL